MQGLRAFTQNNLNIFGVSKNLKSCVQPPTMGLLSELHMRHASEIKKHAETTFTLPKNVGTTVCAIWATQQESNAL